MTSAYLDADPSGPVVPWQLTVRGPDGGGAVASGGCCPLKMALDPYMAMAPSESVTATGPDVPVEGQSTDGLAL